jgi:hypothetical protein
MFSLDTARPKLDLPDYRYKYTRTPEPITTGRTRTTVVLNSDGDVLIEASVATRPGLAAKNIEPITDLDLVNLFADEVPLKKAARMPLPGLPIQIVSKYELSGVKNIPNTEDLRLLSPDSKVALKK